MKKYNYPIKSDMYNLGSVIDYEKLIKIQSGGFEKQFVEDRQNVKSLKKFKRMEVIKRDKR